MSEHDIQAEFFTWVERVGRVEYPPLAYTYAVPNGGARHPAVAVRMKAEGVRPGCLGLHPLTKYDIMGMPRRSDTGRFAFPASAVVCHPLTTPVVGKAPLIRWTLRPAERLGNDGNLIGGALPCR